jgi:hypothetical protein
VRQKLCAMNSSHPNTGFKIIVPGLGLLNRRVRLRTGQSSWALVAHFLFPNWGGQTDLHRYQRRHRAQCCCYTMTTIQTGLLGRTRTDEYGFTKSALWLQRHKGKREMLKGE